MTRPARKLTMNDVTEKRPPHLRSIRNPAMRRRLAADRFSYVENALTETHQTIYRQHPWPSRELEMVNRVTGFLFPLFRALRGLK